MCFYCLGRNKCCRVTLNAGVGNVKNMPFCVLQPGCTVYDVTLHL